MKHNAIIGMDILQNFKIDLRNDEIKFINNILHKKNTEISTIFFNKEKIIGDNDLICNKEAEIAPHSDRNIYFRTKNFTFRSEHKFFPHESFYRKQYFRKGLGL